MIVRDSGAGFAVGFLMGAVIGLAIGFLYAPQSGKETREQLKAKVETAMGKATEVVEKAKEAVAEARKVAEAKLEEVKEQTK